MKIEEIKSRLSVVEVLAKYGHEMNRNKHVCCPFHDDKTPSMKVFLDSGVVRCFSGNCARSGKNLDVIELVKLLENCSKHEAIMKCKSFLNYENQIKMKKMLVDPTFYSDLWQYFKSSYEKSSKAKDYAKTRGLLGLEMGYNNGTWHRKVADEFLLEQAKKIGILLPSRSGTGYQIWGKNCLIFPLRNKLGEVVSFYGRSLSKGHFYLSNRSGLYPGYPKSCKRLILTESIIDAASLLQLASLKEDYQVLALFGTNGLSEEHRLAIGNCKGLEEIILMLDGDEAGKKASKKLGKFLVEAYLPKQVGDLTTKLQIKIASVPKNTDVNELWSNHLSEDLFLELLEQAKVLEGAGKGQKVVATKLKIVNENYYQYETEKLFVEVLGGIDLEGMDKLDCTLRITRKPKRNALDKLRQRLNLYQSAGVKSLLKKLQEDFELGLQELRLCFADLIEQLEVYREENQSKVALPLLEKRVLSPAREASALAYLQDKNLAKNTREDLTKIGIVGEAKNAFTMYLSFCSRKLPKPLHIISLGKSGSGKTHLQETIAQLIPEQEIINITSLSDNALYYYPKGALKHTIFLLEDMDGMSDEAKYALRELKSKGVLTKDVVLKNGKGKMHTGKLKVDGPICFAGCTTSERVYEDNANRCLLLYRDESKAHKKAVMEQQRKAAAGKIDELEKKRIQERHKDIQMLLKPIKIVNPFAEDLVLPEQVFKPLRTNAHYLQFIEVITFYHQYQRKVKKSQSGVKYIETTIEDIELANELMKDILLAKSDELSWGVRAFLEKLKAWVKRDNIESFTGKMLRQHIRILPVTMKKYMYQLRLHGMADIIGGSKYKGYEYILTNADKYQNLQEKIEKVLAETLQKIKNQ